MASPKCTLTHLPIFVEFYLFAFWSSSLPPLLSRMWICDNTWTVLQHHHHYHHHLLQDLHLFHLHHHHHHRHHHYRQHHTYLHQHHYHHNHQNHKHFTTRAEEVTSLPPADRVRGGEQQEGFLCLDFFKIIFYPSPHLQLTLRQPFSQMFSGGQQAWR